MITHTTLKTFQGEYYYNHISHVRFDPNSNTILLFQNDKTPNSIKLAEISSLGIETIELIGNSDIDHRNSTAIKLSQQEIVTYQGQYIHTWKRTQRSVAHFLCSYKHQCKINFVNSQKHNFLTVCSQTDVALIEQTKDSMIVRLTITYNDQNTIARLCEWNNNYLLVAWNNSLVLYKINFEQYMVHKISEILSGIAFRCLSSLEIDEGYASWICISDPIQTIFTSDEYKSNSLDIFQESSLILKELQKPVVIKDNSCLTFIYYDSKTNKITSTSEISVSLISPKICTALYNNVISVAVCDSISSYFSYIEYDSVNSNSKEEKIKPGKDTDRVIAVQYINGDLYVLTTSQKTSRNTFFFTTSTMIHELQLHKYTKPSEITTLKVQDETPRLMNIITTTETKCNESATEKEHSLRMVLDSINDLAELIENRFSRIEQMLMSLSTRVANIEKDRFV